MIVMLLLQLQRQIPYVNFAAYDTDSNDNLSLSELQVIFLVAGGESSSLINSPGGVWAAS